MIMLRLFTRNRTWLAARVAVFIRIVVVASVVLAAPASIYQTPVTPMELPVEVEIELSPAGSLKQAALWKELYQLLENPYAPVERRPGFGVDMPELNTYDLGYNFLTGQPLRLRTSDGETSWDQPGPLFDPEEEVATDAFSSPTEIRTIIGHLVACPNEDDPATTDINETYQAAQVPEGFCDEAVSLYPGSSLVVYNPDGHEAIPPDGTVVAVAAYFDGMLHELEFDVDGVWDGEYEEIHELEAPINEEDFYRDPADTTDVPGTLQPYIGRLAAETLGKALFWDMQIGSDGVQACASCHFSAGADNRTRNQVNPGFFAGDSTFDIAQPNEELEQSDFPFHKLADPEVGGEETMCGVGSLPACGSGTVLSDANDVVSSMGVSQYKQFVNIPTIGTFIAASSGVRPLPPDIGIDAADPIPDMDGFRRVEPRNTPTFHGAAFNFDNFWDGRARFNFNGGSVFGPSDPQAHIFINPGLQTNGTGAFTGATNGDIRPELIDEDPGMAAQPVRIKFSSLASQAVGPPLSDFEMSFAGRNWPKIGKKLLQGEPNSYSFGNGAPQQPKRNLANAVVPLANQLVAIDDSRLGPFSNQGGAACIALGRPTALNKPGLCISYGDLIRLSFERQYWNRDNRHLLGAPGADPFDGYVLNPQNGNCNAAACRNNRDRFRQIEANFSLFFALSVQAYEQLTIPDDTPADRFFDANPYAGNGVGEPGDQAVLYPTLIADLIDDGIFNGTSGTITLIPDDPSTPEYDGFGPDEVFGFDIFAGANLTAVLPPDQSVDPISGINRNPQITNSIGQDLRVGSNPFTRSAKCMLCHLGPEQTDHSINISHGLLKNDAEFEYPTPPGVADPNAIPTFEDGLLPAPEPSGNSKTVGGLILAEEVGEGAAQDAVEVEPRNFATFDDPATPWDDRIVGQPENFAFGDQGVYNIGLRPSSEDMGRGANDGYGWPLSLAALTLKNIGGAGFEPNDNAFENNVIAMFDPDNIEAEDEFGDPIPGQQGFEETGDGALYPGTDYDLQSINPGYERNPNIAMLPAYMVPWMHSLPAGELHPQIDEMAGMVPNTVTPPNGGPGIEFPEVMFGADFHCALYDPAQFGFGPPNYGWGSPNQEGGFSVCPQNQSGVPGNMSFASQGTWPVPNRVLRDGAFKAPSLRNVEMTGPYFHTGSYLTLRQVVDFYMRGGDFPITNADSRDPNIMDIDMQAFSFGTTNVINDPNYTDVNFGFLQGSFGDGLPDTAFLYDEYPDSDHAFTPELSFGSREDALEDAKTALVRFLLALSDPRVKYERAPFDHPELFVPIDGTAPENTKGRAKLVTLSGKDCTGAPVADLSDQCFKQLPPVGAGGNSIPVPNFLEISSAEVIGPNNDHFDR